MHPKAEFYIDKLKLIPHPEGGFYSEVYRSDEVFNAGCISTRYINKRNISSSIYFLLEGEQVSHFHRLKSDEVWHFYDGCSLTIYLIDRAGQMKKIFLGNNIDKGERFQAVIERGLWFGAELKEENSFSLIGCSVSPGFDFEDFEMGERNFLLKLSPTNKEIIEKLTKLNR